MRQTAARLDAAPSRDVRPALLVVDDEEVLRHALRSYFSLEGFRVDTAGSVESALARMEERSGGGHAPYAAVISDLRLDATDEQSGIVLLRRVRDRVADARLIAATHRDLAQLVREGRFRADRYFRVSTVQLAIPPLRERPEDIPVLAADLLARLAADLGREGVAVRAGALALKPGAGHIVRTLIAAARRGPRFTHRSNLHVDPR